MLDLIHMSLLYKSKWVCAVAHLMSQYSDFYGINHCFFTDKAVIILLEMLLSFLHLSLEKIATVKFNYFAFSFICLAGTVNMSPRPYKLRCFVYMGVLIMTAFIFHLFKE